MASRLALFAFLSIIAFQAGLVRADPTPPSAAEACTVESQRRPGDECLACGAWDGDSAICLKRLSPKGYGRRCRGAGTSRWSEVWCRPKPAAR